MSLVELGGIPVVAGTVTRPRTGCWVADLETERPPPPGVVRTKLTGPSLELSGSVVRRGVFGGRSRVRIVGGAGRLPTVLPARAFRSMPVSLLLEDITVAAGERAAALDDALGGRSLLAWVRAAMPAGQAVASLAELFEVGWRVLDDGTIWVGEDNWRASAVDGVVLHTDPIRRSVFVAPSSMGVAPGTTWQGFRVEAVTHTIEATGFRTEIATP